MLLAGAACAGPPLDRGINPANPTPQSAPDRSDATCIPTDQDQYLYRPARLQLVQSCARAVGTVMAISPVPGADGDIHMDLRLDPPYQWLLVLGNEQNKGYLIVEVICQSAPVQADAVRICAADTDPYHDPLPRTADHIWVEGRYVLDLQHHSWAELHPLY